MNKEKFSSRKMNDLHRKWNYSDFPSSRILKEKLKEKENLESSNWPAHTITHMNCHGTHLKNCSNDCIWEGKQQFEVWKSWITSSEDVIARSKYQFLIVLSKFLMNLSKFVVAGFFIPFLDGLSWFPTNSSHFLTIIFWFLINLSNFPMVISQFLMFHLIYWLLYLSTFWGPSF